MVAKYVIEFEILCRHAYKASEFASNCSCATLGGLFARHALGLASHRNLITPGRHRQRHRRRYQYQYTQAIQILFVSNCNDLFIITGAQPPARPLLFRILAAGCIEIKQSECFVRQFIQRLLSLTPPLYHFSPNDVLLTKLSVFSP